MKRVRRFVKRSLLMLMLMIIPSAVEFGQSELRRASFATTCSNCWPGWSEVTRPTRGIGPRVANGRAFIFINGSQDTPASNQQHLQFRSSPLEVSKVSVEFNFNNATLGGRLRLTSGGFLCLTPAWVNAFVTEELFVITLADDGNTWYGAFLGDLTLIDPEFGPTVGSGQPYTAIGLLQQRDSELEVLAVKVIPQVTRFSLIKSSFSVAESNPAGASLRAAFEFADGRKEIVTSEIASQQRLSRGTAGIIYLVGNGSPCTSFVQREVVMRSFVVR